MTLKSVARSFCISIKEVRSHNLSLNTGSSIILSVMVIHYFLMSFLLWKNIFKFVLRQYFSVLFMFLKENKINFDHTDDKRNNVLEEKNYNGFTIVSVFNY